MEHLDRAAELFSRYGAKLYLDQVLAKKQVHQALARSAPSERARTS